MPPQDDLPRWQGKVDAFMETTPQRIETLFETTKLLSEKIQLLDDELTQHLAALSKQLSNLTARLAVIAAVGSFIGTVVTSLFVAAIIKIFLK